MPACSILEGVIRFKGEDISRFGQIRYYEVSLCTGRKRLFIKRRWRKLELGAYIEHDRNEIEKKKKEVLNLFPILEERRRQIAEQAAEQQVLAVPV